METLISKYNDTLLCPDNVFYYCNRTQSLVVMKRIESTITNENRKYIIDEDNTRYRANVLKLEQIICLKDQSKQIHSVKIPYRTGPNTHHWKTFKVGDTIGSLENKFNKFTMYFGIPFFKTVERVYHEHLIHTGQAQNIINTDGDYSIDTYDSFGKKITRTFANDGTELYSVGDMFSTIGVTIDKKVNKFFSIFASSSS